MSVVAIGNLHALALVEISPRDELRRVAICDGWIPIGAFWTDVGVRVTPHASIVAAAVGWVGEECKWTTAMGQIFYRRHQNSYNRRSESL